MPKKIQLAIQGGGAKLTTLLAAASAIQDLQARNQITVTRIVGTSAGAIVGALLAANIDIEAFRAQLVAGSGKRISSSLAAPGGGKWFRTILTGQPVWRTDELKSILEGVFKDYSQRTGKPLSTLSEIQAATGVELRVVAADLRTPVPIVYKPNGNDKNVITALLDSAGIPIYFRTWKHGSLVDGGLVQNFPWDELLDPQSPQTPPKYGPIIGISFQNGTRDIATSPGDYASALLNTALDAATERSRARLGNDRMLTLPSKFDTFDFKGALSEHALGDHFRLIKVETSNWFESFLRQSGTLIQDDPWVSTSFSVMEKLGRMYELQHEQTMLKYRQMMLEIMAYTFEQEGRPDVINYSFSFFTLDKDVYCHSIALSQGPKDSGSFKQSAIKLLGPDGALIPTDYLPIVDPATPEKREIILFFDRILPANSGPYTLKIQDIVTGLMGDLFRDRRDVLFIRTERTKQPIDNVKTVLHVPEQFKTLRMVSASDLNERQVAGREMTPQELADFDGPGPGWITVGWTGQNAPPTEFFGPSLLY